MGNAHSDAERFSFINAVNEVARNPESKSESAERIGWIASCYEIRQLLAFAGVLGANGRRWPPHRIAFFSYYFRDA
jgi:hypothetical protein